MDDMGDILVFHLVKIGLFSATVVVFIMESYKMLSPDDITILLTQASQQLVSISNGTPLQNVTVQSNAQFKPTASAIRINVMWFLSLVLNLTSALSAVSTLRLPRRCLEFRYRCCGFPYKYDNVFIKGSNSLPVAVKIVPTLLHLSIFLFIAGLIDFLLSINKTVAFCVLGYVSAFSFACIVSSALPDLYLDSSHRGRTPFRVTGLPWRISLFPFYVCIRQVGGAVHDFLSSIWNRAPLRATELPRSHTPSRDALESQIHEHQTWPADDMRPSIDPRVNIAQCTADASTLGHIPSAFNQDQVIEDFGARISGVFDPRGVSSASCAILSCIDVPSDPSTSKPILGHGYGHYCGPAAGSAGAVPTKLFHDGKRACPGVAQGPDEANTGEITGEWATSVPIDCMNS
ncbi:hypothetical protein BJV74DRAFT_988489 [Russula compacta]|nr:hypothetical protein BJV74DRAFT_988489 [Russula compacta]